MFLFDYQLKLIIGAWFALLMVIIFLVAKERNSTTLFKIFQISLATFVPVIGVLIVTVMILADKSLQGKRQ